MSKFKSLKVSEFRNVKFSIFQSFDVSRSQTKHVMCWEAIDPISPKLPCHAFWKILSPYSRFSKQSETDLGIRRPHLFQDFQNWRFPKSCDFHKDFFKNNNNQLYCLVACSLLIQGFQMQASSRIVNFHNIKWP